jgi:hypothetical protein
MIIAENTIILEILAFLSDGMLGIDVRNKYLKMVQAIFKKNIAIHLFTIAF